MFKIKRIATRLAFWYILLVLLVFGGVITLIVYNYSNYILKEKRNVSNQKISILTNELENSFNCFQDIQSRLISDWEISQIISQNSDSAVLSKTEQALIDDKLKELRSEQRGVDAIYILDDRGNIIGSATDSITASQKQDFPGLLEFILSKSYGSFPVCENSQDSSTVNYYGAYYLRPQYSYGAYIAIRINKNRMFYNFEHLSGGFFENIIVLNQGEKIYASNPDLSSPKSKDLKNSLVQLGQTSYMVFQDAPINYPSWEVFALANQQNFSQEVRKLTCIIISFFALTILFISFASFSIAKSITHPLVSVNVAMSQLEKGEFPSPVPSRTKDEIHHLIMGFNRMVKSLKQLTENIRQEQNEKREIEVAMVKSQLELLQSQINPHFIHNTLNTLNYMATTAGNSELSETIVSFNSLLRASISSNHEFIPLIEEMRYIKDYMNIQYRRYSFNSIAYEPSIAPNVEFALVPRLILQPLVENALFHGLLPLTDRLGYIKILVFLQEEQLHIYIVDNGIGIPGETLDLIIRGELPNHKGYSHIGIHNVKERLELIYQDQCQFCISSTEGSGTTIYFSIPYTSEDQEV